MELLTIGITIAVAVLSPILSWWGSSRYFSGRFEEWKSASEEWRKRTDERLDSFNEAQRATLDENVRLRLENTEKELERLREWKHTRAEPYVNALENMNERVLRLEKITDDK